MGEGEEVSYADLLSLECLSVRPVLSRDELRDACRRVYWSFRQRRYIEENLSEMRLSVFNAFPTTVTFVAILRGTVIASATLVEDTPVGLPMDEIYHEELRALRDGGRRLTEVTMLADRRHHVQRAVPMLLLLMKRLFDYSSLVARASDMCVAINPRHEDFYAQYLLFERLGPPRPYPSLLSNPALGMRLDVKRLEEESTGREDLQEQFFENRTPLALLENRYRMTCEDLRFFFIEFTPIFREAAPAAIDCLRQCYPNCPWDDWKAAWQRGGPAHS